MRKKSQTYTWERLAQGAVTFLTWVLAEINQKYVSEITQEQWIFQQRELIHFPSCLPDQFSKIFFFSNNDILLGYDIDLCHEEKKR